MKNEIKCSVCGDIVESKFRHDFKRCKCGESFVDGGKDYRRVGGKCLIRGKDGVWVNPYDIRE